MIFIGKLYGYEKLYIKHTSLKSKYIINYTLIRKAHSEL